MILPKGLIIMRIKKIISAVLASVIAAGMCAANAFAVEDGGATYCFDTDAKISEFASYGSIEETGAKLTHTTLESSNGAGCIVVSVNSKGKATNLYGGFFVEASQFGLESFDGCKVEMNVKLAPGATSYYDAFALYSDGTIWLSQPVTDLTSDKWTNFSMVVATGSENAKVGFTIPTYQEYKGDVVYVDDFTITDAEGKVIANRGDYEAKAVVIEDAPSKGTNIGLTILLVLLIFGIVGGIGLIVSSAIRRFS